ncbi:phage major capsid protein [Methylocella silvestris]|uniref:Phage major capsid protein n=1 Tax=Methylocella silvestris TaxID=199596 RepID=A0A2J7TBU3_METSI|nr:phage major capsid protein [Methylocella silvestris]PNG24237.1 phage major capsid protein [Methylocella silvestris]
MAGIQDLREQRFALVQKAQAILDRKPFRKQDSDECDALYEQIAPLDGQIRNLERVASAAFDLEGRAYDFSNHNGRSIDENAAKIDASRKAFNRALCVGMERLTPEERALVSADAPGNRGRIVNVAEGTSVAGGYLVPTIVMPTVISKLKAFGGMRTVARVLATDGGAPIAWPTSDDTSAVGELVAENVAATVGDMTFGVATLQAFKFSSKIVPVSFEVLQDAAADVESVVFDGLTTRLARSMNVFFTNGTGTGQPFGVVNQAALGYTMPTGNTAGITYDGLISLYHSVDPAYRSSQNCAFMMNDTTFKAIKLLKDGAGRPIWLPSTSGALGGDQGFDTLLGARLVINQDMVSPAANAKTVLFGDFSKYMIRDVMSMLLLRFTDSAYTAKGQIGFLAWARADGRMIDASNESIRYLQQSAT